MIYDVDSPEYKALFPVILQHDEEDRDEGKKPSKATSGTTDVENEAESFNLKLGLEAMDKKSRKKTGQQTQGMANLSLPILNEFQKKKLTRKNEIGFDLHNQKVKHAMLYVKINIMFAMTLKTIQKFKIVCGRGGKDHGEAKIKTEIKDILEGEVITPTLSRNNSGEYDIDIPHDRRTVNFGIETPEYGNL